MLTRSFLPADQQSNLLAYTPMFHSKMFVEAQKYRDSHFQPLKSGVIPSPPDAYHLSQLPQSELHLDGNPAFDRPLTVQFCSNDPDDFLNAAKHVAPFCDAVDLNLGCPQGIAKRGHYGSFLQEDWPLISRMIRKLHEELDVPVTAKMRVLETREKTLAYAKMILDSGASILTVHGRRREQKGHNTGLADWSMIRYLRDNLPKDTVIFANGNILQHDDIAQCLAETGADAVMSAEGNLHDPTIFAEPPPVGQEGREYWRGRDGKGGYRVDAVMRRYLDIIHKYALGREPPARKPLFLPSDPVPTEEPTESSEAAKSEREEQHEDGPPRKKQKQSKAERKQQKISNPNLTAMQAHLFHLLRPLVGEHHNVRDALAKSRVGDIDAFENVLSLVEEAVKQGLIAYEKEQQQAQDTQSHGSEQNGALASENGTPAAAQVNGNAQTHEQHTSNGLNASAAPALTTSEPSHLAPETLESDPHTSSAAAIARCKRPWWVCQAYVRPVPKEAIEKGSMQLSKKEKKRLEEEAARKATAEAKAEDVGLVSGGRVEKQSVAKGGGGEKIEVEAEIPKDGVVCG
jgi:tRNA-dihydrouridine synthase 1